MKRIVKINFSLSLLLVLVFIQASCKKKSKTETVIQPVEIPSETPKEDTAFKTFMKYSEFAPSGYELRSMTYDPITSNLFFYAKKSVPTGYAILQLNTITKQAITVFDFNDPNWLNSNGSEGRRIRIFGNDLYVMGGANNNFVHRLSGVANNGLTLASSIAVPSNFGGSPYDITLKSGTLYIINMNDRITYGNSTLANAAAFTINNTTHGASIVMAGSNLACSNGSTNPTALELRNKTTGAFIRSVPLQTNANSALELDLSNRIILIQKNKIIRYTADLLSKEEFKAFGASDEIQIGIHDKGDDTIIYMLSGGEVKTMTIKS